MQECAETGCSALNITEYWQGVMCVRQGPIQVSLAQECAAGQLAVEPHLHAVQYGAPHGGLGAARQPRVPGHPRAQPRHVPATGARATPPTFHCRGPNVPYVPCLQNLRHLLLETQFSGENRAATGSIGRQPLQAAQGLENVEIQDTNLAILAWGGWVGGSRTPAKSGAKAKYCPAPGSSGAADWG